MLRIKFKISNTITASFQKMHEFLERKFLRKYSHKNHVRWVKVLLKTSLVPRAVSPSSAADKKVHQFVIISNADFLISAAVCNRSLHRRNRNRPEPTRKPARKEQSACSKPNNLSIRSNFNGLLSNGAKERAGCRVVL